MRCWARGDVTAAERGRWSRRTFRQSGTWPGHRRRWRTSDVPRKRRSCEEGRRTAPATGGRMDDQRLAALDIGGRLLGGLAAPARPHPGRDRRSRRVTDAHSAAARGNLHDYRPLHADRTLRSRQARSTRRATSGNRPPDEVQARCDQEVSGRVRDWQIGECAARPGMAEGQTFAGGQQFSEPLASSPGSARRLARGDAGWLRGQHRSSSPPASAKVHRAKALAEAKTHPSRKSHRCRPSGRSSGSQCRAGLPDIGGQAVERHCSQYVRRKLCP